MPEERFDQCSGPLLRDKEFPRRARRALEDLRERVGLSIEAGRQSLTRIESALEELSASKEPVGIVVKRRAAMRVASVRCEVNGYAEIERIERDLLQALPGEAVGRVRGTLWHRCADAGLPEGEPFVELNFVELKKDVPRRNFYRIGELPAVTAACAYCTADDDASERAYLALRRWLHVGGYHLAGPMREIYLDGMLEIQFPLQ